MSHAFKSEVVFKGDVDIAGDVTLSDGLTLSQFQGGDMLTVSSQKELQSIPEGTNGQLLVKGVSGSAWGMTATLNNPMTTRGDIIVGGSGGVEERLPVGASNTVLSYDPITGPTWKVVESLGTWVIERLVPSSSLSVATTFSQLFESPIEGELLGFTVVADSGKVVDQATEGYDLRLGMRAHLITGSSSPHGNSFAIDDRRDSFPSVDFVPDCIYGGISYGTPLAVPSGGALGVRFEPMVSGGYVGGLEGNIYVNFTFRSTQAL